MRICQYYVSAEERETDTRRRVPRHANVGIVVHDHVVPVTNMVSPGDTSVGMTLATNVVEWLESRSSWTMLREWASRQPTATLMLRDVFLAAPVLRPGALICFDAFEEHARAVARSRGQDLDETWYHGAQYYNGNVTALLGHGQKVPFLRHETQIDFELQIACVIGRTCRNVSADAAEGHIAGYCILNDWTARDTQASAYRLGVGPSRGKDHATSLGPALVTRDELINVMDLGMRALVNGEQVCEGYSGTSKYTFGQLVSAASQGRTLFPGDVIASGAVAGGSGLEAGRFLKPGDTVRLEVDGLGALENQVYVE